MLALVVEDEPLIALELEAILSESGFRSECVASIRDAVAAAKARRVDLVVADIELQDGRADLFLEGIRGAEPGIPILIVSAYRPEEIEVNLEGPVKHLTKPFSEAAFRKALAELMGSA